MNGFPTLNRFVTLVEAMVDVPDQHLRDRILLETVFSLGFAGAAGLWRRFDARADEVETQWSPTLERGSAELLPEPSLVRAMLSEEEEFSLPSTYSLHRADVGAASAAVVLGDVRADEEQLDLLDALLHVWCATGDGASAEPGGTPTSPLPTADRDPEGDEEKLLRHDFRNLLSGLCSTHELAHLFASEDDGPSARKANRDELEKHVERECRRAGDLLATTLRDGVRAAPLADDDHTLEVLHDAIRSVRASFGKEDIRVRSSVTASLGTSRLALDTCALDRVVRNLLINAAEAHVDALRSRRIRRRGNPDPWIELAFEPSRGPETGFVLRVEDNGPGIAREVLQDFGRIGVTTKGRDGRGMGLAAVSKLVRVAGGDLRIRNVPHAGCRVEVWIPSL